MATGKFSTEILLSLTCGLSGGHIISAADRELTGSPKRVKRFI